MDYKFDFQGKTYTAVDAEWEKNGERVWDILDENDEFVTNVSVHPFDYIEAVVNKWVEMELCFA